MKNLKQILLSILILFSINVFAQSSKIAAPTKASVNDSILAVSSTQTARHIPFSELRTRVLSDIEKITLDTLAFNGGGFIDWNTDDFTINVDTGIGPVLQVGQELYTVVYNNSGGQIDNGKAVYPVGSFTGRPSIEKAIANTHENIERPIYITTMDIPNGEYGLVTHFGYVRGIDTNGLIEGQEVYLSATTAGEFTSTAPEFPNYLARLGGATTIDVSNGAIFVNISADPDDTFSNFWNGTFRETFDFIITSDGATITGSLSPSNGHPNMTMFFSDGKTMLDTSPSATITLTAGTDTNPQSNYVYVLKSTKALTLSTAGFPTDEHIKVSSSFLQNAATTQTNGSLRNQNYNDHLESTISFQGHLPHITERIRVGNAKWDSGVGITTTIIDGPTPDDVFTSTTGGLIYQLHKQSFPAQDLQTGDDIHIVNHSTTPYLTTTNLNTQIVDALGNSLNNTSFSFIVWGVINSMGETSHLMLNLPTDSYAFASPQNAVNDALNYSVYTIPKAFEGVGFLIAKLTFTYKNDDWVLFDTTDLRGAIPNTTAGGGVGGVGNTEFTQDTDTPSSYIGEANKIVRVGSGETALEFSDDYVTNTTDETVTGTKTYTSDQYILGNLGIGITNPDTGLHIKGDYPTGFATIERTGVNGNGSSSMVNFVTDGKTIGDGIAIPMSALNSADEETNYGLISTFITNPTDGIETADFRVSLFKEGNISNPFIIEGATGNATFTGTVSGADGVLGSDFITKQQLESFVDVTPKNLSWGESYINNWRDKVLDDGATYFPNSGGYEMGKLHQSGSNPSLLFIPSAVQTDSLYLVKGSPNFTVNRASIATYVDENGIIQTAGFDVARIDYSDNSDGVLLTEPESENLALWSEDFSNAFWNKLNSSVSGGISFPSGDNPNGAFKLIEDNTLNRHEIRVTSTLPSTIERTYSIFAKKSERNWVYLGESNVAPTDNFTVYFDLENGVVGSIGSSIDDYSMVELSDGWYRCSVTFTNPGVGVPSFGVANSDLGDSYIGDGVSGIFILNRQTEVGLTLTSYIKTEGSTVTRLQDEITIDLSSFTPTITEIIETIDGVDQTPITVIPPTYTIPFGNINKIIMN